MAKTRSQEDTKGKDVESEDPLEQRVSKLETALDQGFSTINQRFSLLDQRFAELRDLLGLRIDCDEEQLPVMDDETELLEEETMPQSKVPIANSEIMKSIELGKVDLGLEKLEYVVLNENLEQEWDQKNVTRKLEVDGDVERGQKVMSDTKIFSAHQPFDQKPVRVTHREKHMKHIKAWKFKFKPTSKRSRLMNDKFSFVDATVLLNKDLQEMSCFLSEKSLVEFVGYEEHGRELLIVGVKQLTLAATKFYLKHKWRSRLLQSFSELKQGFSNHLKLWYYSLKRESGTKVHHANTQASMLIRTTLAPSSMLKRLLDAVGIVVTTDENAILLEIDVAHPAAKSMIELSHPQDEEVGVGTTSVIVLAGEFSQPIDVKDRATVLGVVKSCIGTKFISEFGDLIADLAIDATTTISVDLGQGLREVDISGLACHYFSKVGVSTIRWLRKTDNNRIAKACRAVIVNRSDELQESDVIICPLVDHLKKLVGSLNGSVDYAKN